MMRQPASPAVPATLIEAHQFEPCDSNCMIGNRPTTAYCLSIGDSFVVGERQKHLWLGEDDAQSLRSEAGNAVLYQAQDHTFRLTAAGRSITINLGTKFEPFQNSACRAEVHKAKLEKARASKRPVSVPPDAVAIPGSFEGDYRPNFVWHQCKSESDLFTCAKWYPDGSPRGIDHYCSVTQNGEALKSLELDPISSVEGKLVLASGKLLQADHRGRTNNNLDHPNEACH